jgi:hypothetical protein
MARSGIEPISGDVIGFLLGVNAPGDAIYITGDTVWYDGTAEIARRFSPKLVMLSGREQVELVGEFSQTLWYYRSLADIFCERLSNQ